MKPEERHELAHNDLEIHLQRLWMWFQKNWHIPLLVLALCLLAFQGYNWWKTEQDRKAQEAWNELTLAGEGENVASKLKGVIAKYDQTAVRAFAYKQLGDFYSELLLVGAPLEGYRGVKATRSEALVEAREAYQKVIQDYTGQALAVTLAKLGLGRIYEADGQWDKAAELYKQLAADKDSPAYAAEAQRRLDHQAQWKASAGRLAAVLIPATAPATAPDIAPATAPATPGK